MSPWIWNPPHGNLNLSKSFTSFTSNCSYKRTCSVKAAGVRGSCPRCLMILLSSLSCTRCLIIVLSSLSYHCLVYRFVIIVLSSFSCHSYHVVIHVKLQLQTNVFGGQGGAAGQPSMITPSSSSSTTTIDARNFHILPPPQPTTAAAAAATQDRPQSLNQLLENAAAGASDGNDNGRTVGHFKDIEWALERHLMGIQGTLKGHIMNI